MRWLVRERLYRQWWVCWGFAYSTYRVAYGVVYRASSVAHFDKEISHSEVIQLSSVVWIYRRALDCYRASSNPLSSFTRVPHDKESAVVQSLKPKVARSVLLDCSFYAVPRGVLKLQSVSSRMPLLQCVVEYCWSIHVGWHRPPRTGRDGVAQQATARVRGSRRRYSTGASGTSAWQHKSAFHSPQKRKPTSTFHSPQKETQQRDARRAGSGLLEAGSGSWRNSGASVSGRPAGTCEWPRGKGSESKSAEGWRRLAKARSHEIA